MLEVCRERDPQGFSPNTVFLKKQEHENIRTQSCFIFRLLTNPIYDILASFKFNVYHPQSKELRLKNSRLALISKSTNEQKE